MLIFVSGTRVGRVRVIFELPKHLDVGLGPQAAPNAWPKEPLAYVEWYGAPRSLPDENTGMYVIKKPQSLNIPLLLLQAYDRVACLYQNSMIIQIGNQHGLLKIF